MSHLLIALAFFLLGVLSFPFLLFLRARRDEAWNDSNMANMIRLVAHIATHPSDFGKMSFEDGKKPFWYINKDEFSDVVNSRPNRKGES